MNAVPKIIKKTTRLKNLITSSKTEFLLESHNAICAKLVEEAGFSGIWASGLSMSAALGVRDNNELSWTQVLDQLEFMVDACNIPILVDGDSGYGNFNNVRRLVRKLEERGLAGLCIEDKLFPKTNSFITSKNQALTLKQEFVGKIKAAKDVQKDSDFCLVARTEAFITEHGLGEALERAIAYYEAGADAILVHSRISNASEIESFMKHWDVNCPIIIVPTTYHTTPTTQFEKLGISVVIFANHMIRASVKKMQEVALKIWDSKSIYGLENELVSLKELFRLQHDEELREAENKYLPAA
jgi:phosphoenolpyruvate phosphomutase